MALHIGRLALHVLGRQGFELHVWAQHWPYWGWQLLGGVKNTIEQVPHPLGNTVKQTKKLKMTQFKLKTDSQPTLNLTINQINQT